MRLLLWVLLVTLVTLLTSTDAAMHKVTNSAQTKSSKIDSFPVRVLAADYDVNDKRSLRASNDKVTTDEEERAFSISNLVNQAKTVMGKSTAGVAGQAAKMKKYTTNLIFKRLYNSGATPTNLKVRLMGTNFGKSFLDKYNVWWKKVRANPGV